VRALVLPCLLLATSCAHEVVRGGELNLPAVNAIAEDTARTRGLEIREPIVAHGLRKQQVREYFERRYSGEMPWLETDTKVAHKLGILPGHIHLRDLYKRSYTRNAAALYERAWCHDDDDDPETACAPIPGRMLIFTELFPRFLTWPVDLMGAATGTDWSYGLITSHELAHALQDQHFGLGEVVPGKLYLEDEDTALARKSVIESEANIVSYAYLFGLDLQAPGQRNLLIEYLLSTRWLSEGLALVANRKSPSFYTKVLTAQYFDGMRFVQRTANAGGGYHALDLAYRTALPESTEQILHPEKLFGPGYDPPKRFAPTDKDLLPGWTWLATDTFGELRLRALLEEPVGRLRAARAARGWGGDRYEVFERAGRVLLAWRLTFDTPEDAVELHSAWRAALHARYPGRLARRAGVLVPDGWTLLRVEPGGEGVPTTEVEYIAMRRVGARVLILEGLDPRSWWADAEVVWRATVPDSPPKSRAAVIPPPAPQRADDGLARSFFLPRRTLEMRAGWTLHQGDRRPGGFRGLEMRWGLRPNLELSFPFVLSVRHADALGFTVVSAGLPSRAHVRGDKALSVTRVFASRQLGLALQLRAEANTSGLVPESVHLAGAAALPLRPFRWLQLTPGASVSLEGEVLGGAPATSFTLGAPLLRGLQRQPLVEVQLIDALHLFETSVIELDAQLQLVRQSHVAGVLLYF
jgi:hypothetical protein